MNSIEVLGLFSGTCTTLSFLPQVIQVMKSRSTKDISLLMYTIFVIGVAGWLGYGILIESPSVIGSNAITLVLSSIILVLKILWKDR